MIPLSAKEIRIYHKFINASLRIIRLTNFFFPPFYSSNLQRAFDRAGVWKLLSCYFIREMKKLFCMYVYIYIQWHSCSLESTMNLFLALGRTGYLLYTDKWRFVHITTLLPIEHIYIYVQCDLYRMSSLYLNHVQEHTIYFARTCFLELCRMILFLTLKCTLIS